MIIGIHSRDNDLVVNPIKGKQLTNVRASGTDEAVRLTPPVRLTLESAVEFIDDDELVEITPLSIRIRKRYLTENERKRAGPRPVVNRTRNWQDKGCSAPLFHSACRLVYTHTQSYPVAIFMESQVGNLVSLLAGLVIGAAAIWLILRERIKSAEAHANGESRIEVARLGERLSALQEEANRLAREKDLLAALRDQLTAEQQRLSNQVAELTTSWNAERNQSRKESRDTEVMPRISFTASRPGQRYSGREIPAFYCTEPDQPQSIAGAAQGQDHRIPRQGAGGLRAGRKGSFCAGRAGQASDVA